MDTASLSHQSSDQRQGPMVGHILETFRPVARVLSEQAGLERPGPGFSEVICPSRRAGSRSACVKKRAGNRTAPGVARHQTNHSYGEDAMGADVMIIGNTSKEEFRDSYNHGNVMSSMGMSWTELRVKIEYGEQHPGRHHRHGSEGVHNRSIRPSGVCRSNRNQQPGRGLGSCSS